MFTGLIEEVGQIKASNKHGKGTRLSVYAPNMYRELKVGDSITVNGVCLTANELSEDGFYADVMPVTMTNTNLGNLWKGSYVNLERAMVLGARLDGHMVTGHVDSKGRIKRIVTEGDAILYQISLQKEIISRLIDRGSIAIDGISLTIQDLNQEDIIVSIIPHTTNNTTLQGRKVGDVVNIETDVIGKYVDRLLNAGKKNTNVNMSFLSECGFV